MKMKLGTVAEVWRYPVKSMQGELVQTADIGPHGLLGDRGWAVRDEAAGEIRGARRLPNLLLCGARYLEPPTAATPSPPVEITLPDGSTVRSDDRDVNERLSAVVGREVSLWPLQPAEDLDHYRYGKVRPADRAADARAIFGLEAGESFPDLSDLAGEPALRGFATPPGTYYDIAPVHLLTTASLAELHGRNPALDTDRRRFRPTLLIDTGDAAGFAEFAWAGTRLRVGEALLDPRMATVRCAITTHAQPGLPHDPQVMRTLVRETQHRLGLYIWVVEPGQVRPGDAVIQA